MRATPGRIIELTRGEDLIIDYGPRIDLSRLWDAVALWVALDSLDGWQRERLLVPPPHTVRYL